jgi:hypothetical protein
VFIIRQKGSNCCCILLLAAECWVYLFHMVVLQQGFAGGANTSQEITALVLSLIFFPLLLLHKSKRVRYLVLSNIDFCDIPVPFGSS